MRCVRVEMWLYGSYVVKYDNEKDPVRKPLMGMRHCPHEATTTVVRDGFIFYWCAGHASEEKK